MYWHVKQNRSLHENVLALTLTVVSTPRMDQAKRITLTEESKNFWRAEAKMGFMEIPNIDLILTQCRAKSAHINLDDVTYYVGHETIIPREDGQGLPHWQTALFAAMGRNAARISDSLHLPHGQVVEIGREIRKFRAPSPSRGGKGVSTRPRRLFLRRPSPGRESRRPCAPRCGR